HETVNAMVDLRVTNRFSEIDLFEHVAELKLPCFWIEFITLSGLEAVMITLLCLLQFPKNLLEASLADSLFCLGGDLYLAALIVLGNVTLIAQFLDEVAHAVFLVRELEVLVKLIQPLQRLTHVATGVRE